MLTSVTMLHMTWDLLDLQFRTCFILSSVYSTFFVFILTMVELGCYY